MKTQKKILVHRHEYGTSIAIFTCDFNTDNLSEEEAVTLAKKCGLDFEPEKSEQLDILDFEEHTPHITKSMIAHKAEED